LTESVYVAAVVARFVDAVPRAVVSGRLVLRVVELAGTTDRVASELRPGDRGRCEWWQLQ